MLQDQENQNKSADATSIPLCPFSFGLYMIHADSKDDFEIPLAEVQHHTLLYPTDTVTQTLLRFYRTILAEEHRRGMSSNRRGNMDLQALLDTSVILRLDRKPGSATRQDTATAMIVAAIHVRSPAVHSHLYVSQCICVYTSVNCT